MNNELALQPVNAASQYFGPLVNLELCDQPQKTWLCFNKERKVFEYRAGKKPPNSYLPDLIKRIDASFATHYPQLTTVEKARLLGNCTYLNSKIQSRNWRIRFSWIPKLTNLFLRIVSLGYLTLRWEEIQTDIRALNQRIYRPFTSDNEELVKALPEICHTKIHFLHVGFSVIAGTVRIYSRSFIHEHISNQEKLSFVRKILAAPMDKRKHYYPLLAKGESVVPLSELNAAPFCTILADLAQHPDLIGDDVAPYQQLMLGTAQAIRKHGKIPAQNFLTVLQNLSERVSKEKPLTILNHWKWDNKRFGCGKQITEDEWAECIFKLITDACQNEKTGEIFIDIKTMSKIVATNVTCLPTAIADIVGEYSCNVSLLFKRLIWIPLNIAIEREKASFESLRVALNKLSAALKRLRPQELDEDDVKDEKSDELVETKEPKSGKTEQEEFEDNFDLAFLEQMNKNTVEAEPEAMSKAAANDASSSDDD